MRRAPPTCGSSSTCAWSHLDRSWGWVRQRKTVARVAATTVETSTVSPRASTSLLLLGHVAQPVEVLRPHRLERARERPQGLSPCPVEPMPPLRPHRHESRVAQHAQVLRDGSERDRQPRRDLARRALLTPDEPEDLLASRLGEDGPRA